MLLSHKYPEIYHKGFKKTLGNNCVLGGVAVYSWYIVPHSVYKFKLRLKRDSTFLILFADGSLKLFLTP